ncbi:unnamed protein product [Prorocentrum cordatum]|uniref:Uncharacterized protein n=1 Tax=Prorocentrum cordatum TaxID=2364126 RepID=A0ABN9TY65_9DINO|nr:unnamed protein product [Polarella glacialis]
MARPMSSPDHCPGGAGAREPALADAACSLAGEAGRSAQKLQGCCSCARPAPGAKQAQPMTASLPLRIVFLVQNGLGRPYTAAKSAPPSASLASKSERACADVRAHTPCANACAQHFLCSGAAHCHEATCFFSSLPWLTRLCRQSPWYVRFHVG